MNSYGRGKGENLGGTKRVENIIRTYCMKNVFSIKK